MGYTGETSGSISTQTRQFAKSHEIDETDLLVKAYVKDFKDEMEMLRLTSLLSLKKIQLESLKKCFT